MPDTPLQKYLLIQKASDQEVLAALRKADTRILQELNKLSDGVGDQVRKSQLQLVRVAILKRNAELWESVGDITAAAISRAAAAGAQTTFENSSSVLKSLLPEEDWSYLKRSVGAQAEKAVETLSDRLGSSKRELSNKVYSVRDLASGKIDTIINNALARGASAKELADDVRGFVNPQTPGGVRYAALRLARTEINNAFHAAQVREAQAEPWVTGLKWNLSGSHPVPDECNEYAETSHVEGGEAGVFNKNEVPIKPHPNCLCYTTPVVLDDEEVLDAIVRGDWSDFAEDKEDGVSGVLEKASDTAFLNRTVQHPVFGEMKAPPDSSRAYFSSKPKLVEADDRFPEYEASPNSEEKKQRIISSLTSPDGELGAGRHYTAKSAFVNEPLRWQTRGTLYEEDLFFKEVYELDGMMKPAVEDFVTYRGVPKHIFNKRDRSVKVGDVLEDPAFSSTTLDPNMTHGFGETMVEIRVPKGYPALWMETFTAHSGESEVLLRRGTRFRYLGITTDNRVLMEVVP